MNERARRNADLIRELLEAVDRGETGLVDRYYAADYVDHHPSPGRSRGAGREGVRNAFEMFRRAFPDTRHTIHHLFAHDDRVVAHVSASGTHRAELMGIAATGRVVSLEAIAIYRIAGGKIAERWCFQGRGVMEQLRENEGSGRRRRRVRTLDIPRKHATRRRRIRGAVYVALVSLVGISVALGVRRFEPAIPAVDRSTLWIDTVERGPMLRQVRGTGTSSCPWPTVACEGANAEWPWPVPWSSGPRSCSRTSPPGISIRETARR